MCDLKISTSTDDVILEMISLTDVDKNLYICRRSINTYVYDTHLKKIVYKFPFIIHKLNNDDNTKTNITFKNNLLEVNVIRNNKHKLYKLKLNYTDKHVLEMNVVNIIFF